MERLESKSIFALFCELFNVFSSKYFAGIVEHSSLGLQFLAELDLLQVFQARASLQGLISVKFQFGHLLSACFKQGFIHCLVDANLVLEP